MELVCKPIAVIRTPFPTKFGIPRQSGLVESATSRILFEEPYRKPEALRGLEGYSHLWLLWLFSASVREGWSPTVRPPRLGGNTRMGVFATRSPFRPNPIGLSCVRLLRIEGCELVVAGADLMDGTPILDIKPYLPFTDARPDATGGFADAVRENTLTVEFPPELAEKLPADLRESLTELLAEDPRPHYQDDPERVYGFPFAGYEVRFCVRDGVLTVLSVENI
ncbi:MAG: tRNA (N6-threonylcarbamoyladenosine(37)-N6)-methyltransferase TrmO [Oscillospiraceae bacterium]|nr:tRNA (N6-threonylcarbamoyladenosine(37)-N6)-methyltransferase TrmO [Oscillospiraceae bacterium]